MGAESFQVNAIGKTAQEAFRSAVDQAAYEYGHAGYTGTIAEKSEFVMSTDSLADVLKLAECKEKLAASVAKAMLADATAQYRAEAIADVLFSINDDRINDKWGPAGCIEIKPEHYLFFGYASS